MGTEPHLHGLLNGKVSLSGASSEHVHWFWQGTALQQVANFLSGLQMIDDDEDQERSNIRASIQQTRVSTGSHAVFQSACRP